MAPPFLMTRGRMRPREHSCSFRVKLPAELVGGEYELAHVSGQTVNATDEMLVLEATRKLEYGPLYYTFLKEVWSDTKKGKLTFEELYEKRMKSKNAAAAETFSPLYVPVVEIVDDCFVVNLPPHTALFSDDPYFFKNGLGFEELAQERDGVVPRGGQFLTGYGFWNDTDDTEEIATDSVELDAYLLDYLPEDVTDPQKQTYLFYQMEDEKKTSASLPPLDSTSLVESAASLQKAVRKVLEDFDLPEKVVAAEADAKTGVIALKFSPLAKSAVTLSVEVKTQADPTFVVQPDGPWSFRTVAGFAAVFQPEPFQSVDYFAGTYPVFVVCKEVRGDSYIDAIGAVPCLAYFPGPDNPAAVESGSLTFRTREETFEIGFLNRNFERITSGSHSDIYLTLRLKSSLP